MPETPDRLDQALLSAVRTRQRTLSEAQKYSEGVPGALDTAFYEVGFTIVQAAKFQDPPFNRLTGRVSVPFDGNAKGLTFSVVLDYSLKFVFSLNPNDPAILVSALSFNQVGNHSVPRGWHWTFSMSDSHSETAEALVKAMITDYIKTLQDGGEA